jgi:hypothetical protein
MLLPAMNFGFAVVALSGTSLEMGFAVAPAPAAVPRSD